MYAHKIPNVKMGGAAHANVGAVPCIRTVLAHTTAEIICGDFLGRTAEDSVRPDVYECVGGN